MPSRASYPTVDHLTIAAKPCDVDRLAEWLAATYGPGDIGPAALYQPASIRHPCYLLAYNRSTGQAVAQLHGHSKPDEHLPDIRDTMLTMDGDPHLTRVDIARDLYYDDPQTLARWLQDAYDNPGHPHTLDAYGAKARYAGSELDGATCYVGTRTSNRFLRIYDKGREQHGPDSPLAGRWWRFEVEIKGEAARTLTAALQESPQTLRNTAWNYARKLVTLRDPLSPLATTWLDEITTTDTAEDLALPAKDMKRAAWQRWAFTVAPQVVAVLHAFAGNDAPDAGTPTTVQQPYPQLDTLHAIWCAELAAEMRALRAGRTIEP